MRSLLALQLGLCIASQAHGIEYLYVEPNVGGSTGGHVALRLGDTVYDYQNAMLGTLRLRRSPYEHFRYVYSVLENRTIHVARLGVSEDAREALLDRLNRRYLVQEKHFAELESLEADLALIRSLRQSAPDVRFDLRGAGFFYGGTEPERSEAIAALRARVEAHYGEGYLRARTAALAEEVNRLSPEVAEHGVAKLSKEDHAGSSYHFSERYTDLVSKLLAIRAVEASRALRREVRRAPQADEFRLTPGERERIESMAHGLEARLVELVESRRPDWGYPVLLGMARLEVLRASLRSGQLVFLDGFGPDPFVFEPSAVQKSRVFLSELRERARADFSASRSVFDDPGEIDERDLARLEDAANRYLELQRGLREDRAVRMQSRALLAAPSARPAGLPMPRVDVETLRRADELANRRLRAYRQALRDTFAYRLLTRNCATELLAVLDVEPGSLDFVPALSYRSVVREYPVEAVGQVVSYRRARLAAMYASENDLLVYLRESNTLTSEIYRANDRDSAFLFFTEDARVMRPLYGSLNLAVGFGEMGWGLLRAPFDRGRTLWSGLKGVFFSVPELFFVNLRKGSLEYGPGDPPRTASELARRAPSKDARRLATAASVALVRSKGSGGAALARAGRLQSPTQPSIQRPGRST